MDESSISSRLPTKVRWSLSALMRFLERYLPRRGLGARGEKLAAKFLKRQGYKIVARGYRSAYGELDLVAVHGRTVVFVEVKTREGHTGGDPAESVTTEKQRRLHRAAMSFIRRHGLWDCAVRFDVISITWPDSQKPQIEHILGAFETPGKSMFG